MKAYFDTSLIVSLTLMEDRWDELAKWIVERMPRPYFSDFGWGEYVSAIGLKVRRGELSEAEADATITAVRDYLGSWTNIATRRKDLARAAEFVGQFDLALRFPDAAHIATAQRLDCVLVTGDQKQAAAAVRLGIDSINPFG